MAKQTNSTTGHLCADSARSLDNSQRGALLLLAALIMAALCMVIALSIDAGRLISASEERQNFADSIALATLEVYYSCDPSNPNDPENPCTGANRGSPATTTTSTPPPSTLPPLPVTTVPAAVIHEEKFNYAIERAYQIGMQNSGTFTGDNAGLFTTDGAINLNDDPSVAITASLATNEEGRIRSGRWWPYRPTGCTGRLCPCGPAGTEQAPPCFQTCSATEGCREPDGNFGTNRLANAFQVHLGTPATSGRGVKRIFSRVFGDTADLTVEGSSTAGSGPATSFAVPKFGVLLIDLSRSMTIDNYLPQNRGATPDASKGQRNVEYAYAFNSNNGSCTGIAQSAVEPTALATSYSVVAPPGSDYLCRTVDDPTNVGLRRDVYAYTNTAADPLLYPQPFSDLLTSARTFVEQFRNSASPLDRLVVIGFYQDLNSLAVKGQVKLFPAGPGFTASPPPFVGNDQTAAMDELELLLANTAAGSTKRVDVGFVPLTNTVSDIPAALRRAQEILRKSVAEDGRQWSSIDPFINLYTAGLTSCNRGPQGLGALSCRSFLSSDAQVNDAAYVAHQTSLMETSEVVAKDLDPFGIKLNVFVGGKTVGSHSPLIRNFDPRTGDAIIGPMAGCAFDSRLRGLNAISWLGRNPTGLLATDYPGDFNQIGRSTNPWPNYFQAGDFLFFASVNGGGWFSAVRNDPCTRSVPAGIDTVCILDTRLGAARLSLNIPPVANHWDRTRGLAIRDGEAPATTLNTTVVGPPLVGEQFLDSDGRLFCNPNGTVASAAQQVARQILSNRPINLVD